MYNLQLYTITSKLLMYNLQLPYGRHGHHGRYGHHCCHGHGGHGGHGGQSKCNYNLLADRLREHVEDPETLPILIFPEGTCINNTRWVSVSNVGYFWGWSRCLQCHAVQEGVFRGNALNFKTKLKVITSKQYTSYSDGTILWKSGKYYSYKLFLQSTRR